MEREHKDELDGLKLVKALGMDAMEKQRQRQRRPQSLAALLPGIMELRISALARWLRLENYHEREREQREERREREREHGEGESEGWRPPPRRAALQLASKAAMAMASARRAFFPHFLPIQISADATMT